MAVPTIYSKLIAAWEAASKEQQQHDLSFSERDKSGIGIVSLLGVLIEDISLILLKK